MFKAAKNRVMPGLFRGSLCLSFTAVLLFTAAPPAAADLYDDANDNIGIGTTAPVRKLDVVGAPGIGIGTTAAADVLVVTSAGNVGIGSTVPLAKLDVSGDVKVSGTLTQGGTGVVDGSGSANYFTKWSDANTVAASSSVYENSGNLGIGTTNPGAKLDVTASASDTVGLSVYTANTGNSAYSVNFNRASTNVQNAFNWQTAGTSNWFLGQDNDATNDLGFYAWGINKWVWKAYNTTGDIGFGNSLSELYIKNNGNVGIGTTGPSELLHVLKSQDAGTRIQISNANTGTSAYAGIKMTSDGGDSYLYRTSAAYSTTAIQDDTVLQDAGGGDIVMYGAAEVARFKNNGNVGIGSTVPLAKLDVSGDVKVSGTLTQGGTGVVDGSGSANYFTKWSDANTVAASSSVYENSGNLGIGTTGPAHKLQVAVGLTEDHYQLRMGTANNYYDIGRNYTDGLLYFYGNQTGYNGYVFGGVDREMVRITNDGNLGIGTTGPGEKLDVSGSIAGSNFYSPATAGTIGQSGGSNALIVYGSTGSAGITNSLLFNAGSAEVMRITDGNVGIGETTPGAKLSVSGGLAVGSSYDTTGVSDGKVIISGNVGIGSTVPLAKLDVAGAISATGTITGVGVTPGGNVTMGDDAWIGLGASAGRIVFDDAGTDGVNIMSGNVGIGETAPGAKLSVSGGMAVGSSYDTTGVSDGNAIISGNVGIGSTVPLAKLDVSGNLAVSGTITGTMTVAGGWTDGGTSVYTTTSTDNVGIGTTAPGAYLHIKGSNISNRGQLSLEGSDYAQLTLYKDATTKTAALYQAQSTGDLAFLNSVSNGNILLNFTGTTGNFYINGANGYAVTLNSGAPANSLVLDSSGNVGIGTTEPNEKLQISGGNLALDNGQYVIFDKNGSGNNKLRRYFGGSYGIMEFIVDGTAITNISPTGLGIGYVDPGTAKLAINGSVGIGTTAPGALLHLSASAPELILDANTQSENLKRTFIASSQVTAGDMVFGTRNDDNSIKARHMVITNNGNVGIGTTGPASSLDVGGTGNVTISLRAQPTLTRTSATGSLTVNSNAGDLIFTPSGSETVRFKSGGNVGIGETAPGAKLSVSGGLAVGSSYDTTGVSDGQVIISGNVGIGTTGPGEKLDVSGSIAGSNFYSPATAGTIGQSGGSNALIVYGSTGSAGITNSLLFNAGSAEVMRITDGNLGIGTTSPNMALSVYNKAGINNDGQVFWGYSGGLLTWDSAIVTIQAQSGNALSFAANALEKMRITTSGNVGIGSTVPLAKLDVAGAISATGTITGAGITPGGNITMGDDAWIGLGASAGRIVFDDAGTDGVNIMSGNVGIGTTAPAHKLDVSGDISLTGSYSGRKLRLASGIGGDSNWMIGYEASPTGAQISTGAAVVQTIYNGATYGYMIRNTSGTSLFEVHGSDGKTYISGNVGIGSTAPLYRLDVQTTGAANYVNSQSGNGAGIFRAVGTSEADLLLSDTGATTGQQVFNWISDGGNMRARLLSDNESSVLQDNILVLNYTGNVGIGETTPGAKLSVSGGLAVGSSYDTTGVSDGKVIISGNLGIGTTAPGTLLSLYGNGTTISPIIDANRGGTIDTKFGTDGNGGFIDVTTNHSLLFYTNDTERARITNAGNVGIGTTGPGQPLQVQHSVDGWEARFGQSASAHVDVSGNQFQALTGAGAGSPLYLNYTNGGNIYTGTGNLGIGTTAPLARLTTNALSTLPGLRVEAAGAESYYAGYYVDAMDVIANPLKLKVDGSTKVTVLTTGNVGIGTTAPDGPLTVKKENIGATNVYTFENTDNTNAASHSRLKIKTGGDTGGDPLLQLTNDTANWIMGMDNSDSDKFMIASDFQLDGGELVTITTTGNVGIGTTGPGAKLALYNDITAGQTLLSITGNSDNAGGSQTLIGSNIAVSGLQTASVYGQKISVTSEDATGITSAYGLYVQPTTTGNFGTWRGIYIAAPSGAGTITNNYALVTEANAGNVGIGETTPGAKLSVSGGLAVGSSYDTTGVSDGKVIISGNVGIGTTSPAGDLHIQDTRVDVYINSTSAGNPAVIYFENPSEQWQVGNGVAGGGGEFAIWETGGTGGKFVIENNTGNVGIGTTGPGAKLEVVSTTNPAARIAYDSSRYVDIYGNSGLFLTSSDSQNNSLTLSQKGLGDGIKFVTGLSTANTEKMRLWRLGGLSLGSSYVGTDPGAGNMIISGNVGIGTTGPGYLLSLGGTSIAAGGQATPVPLLWMDPRYDNAGGPSVNKWVFYENPSAWVGGIGMSTNDMDMFVGPSGNFRFHTGTTAVDGTGASELMVISSTGNVGIGETAPGAKLSVSGGLAVGSSYDTTGVSDGKVIISGNLGIGTTGPGAPLHVLKTGSGDVEIGRFADTTADGNAYITVGKSNATDNGVYMAYNGTGNYLKLGVHGHDNQFIIKNDGNLGIGTTAPLVKLSVVGGRIAQDTWTADGDTAVQYDTVTNALGIATSDRRLKKDFQPLEGALEKALRLNGLLYRDNDQPDTDKKKLGVIAQDVLTVCPEAVFEYKDEKGETYYGVHYERLSVILIEAVKEQQKEIDGLKQEFAEMKQRLGLMASPAAKLK